MGTREIWKTKESKENDMAKLQQARASFEAFNDV
jgi:hypothetical protein